MTFWYDEQNDELCENHPDEWFERTENGEWKFDVSDDAKRQNVIRAVEQMKDEHDERDEWDERGSE